ncbi:hypothetical protein CRI93_13465 [Longimonas halophila]|uniref:Toxin secretion, membrane fusion protein n=1 Tax=Longimonas halophila TaxID=1469170 RepID=A0A2H3P2G4_9BACT|nr:hypothetical protein CRI93_13465 [Longimonas halophila]
MARTVRTVSLRKSSSDAAYWRAQPPEARWQAVEEIRREYHGWSQDAPPRLRRVCRIVKRT